ncbi:2706_t:CDS:2, partial [Acaulospora morrowiae]
LFMDCESEFLNPRKINETGDPLGSRSHLVEQTHFVHSNEDVPTFPTSFNLADAFCIDLYTLYAPGILSRERLVHVISDLKPLCISQSVITLMKS